VTEPPADRPRPSPFPTTPPVSLNKPSTPPRPDYPPMPLPTYGAPPAYAAPPAYPQQPGYGTYGAPPWGQPPMSNGLGLAGMVVGIVAIPFSLILIGVVPAVVGLVLSLIGRGRTTRGRADNGGQALAGVICSAVALAIFVAVLVLVIVNGHAETCDSNGFCSNND
jgi:hypothetical protein